MTISGDGRASAAPTARAPALRSGLAAVAAGAGPAGTAYDLTLTFGYNPASQIVSNTRSNDTYAWTGHGSGTSSSPANGLNQLTSLAGSGIGYDAKGNVTSVGRFDEFGKAQSYANRFAFASMPIESVSQLFYARARMYNPRLPRFMQPDPIGYWGGTNIYTYPTDPVNFTDPLGLAAECVPGPCKDIVVTAPRVSVRTRGSTGWSLGGRAPGFPQPGCRVPMQCAANPAPKPRTPEREPFDPTKDYCGSAGSEGVPDGNWREACKAHDDCYGKPGAIKEVCDARLAVDIAVVCSGRTSFPALCVIPGALYGGGLMVLGWTPFWHPARDAYNAAQGKR
jgi:RHS repeat-associated protein